MMTSPRCAWRWRPCASGSGSSRTPATVPTHPQDCARSPAGPRMGQAAPRVRRRLRSVPSRRSCVPGGSRRGSTSCLPGSGTGSSRSSRCRLRSAPSGKQRHQQKNRRQRWSQRWQSSRTCSTDALAMRTQRRPTLRLSRWRSRPSCARSTPQNRRRRTRREEQRTQNLRSCSSQLLLAGIMRSSRPRRQSPMQRRPRGGPSRTGLTSPRQGRQMRRAGQPLRKPKLRGSPPQSMRTARSSRLRRQKPMQQRPSGGRWPRRSRRPRCGRRRRRRKLLRMSGAEMTRRSSLATERCWARCLRGKGRSCCRGA
mmetsp:Transcript_656/g.2312  ORF Transcript_656/g.2312 Transcript_656/m.2312 type:complete len:311 (-) Transcript_656:773-1705(-)